MSDLFLTWASGCTEENICEYLVYFNSLKRHARGVEVVCLTNNLLPEHERFISKTGCRVIKVSDDLPCEYVLRDRWLHYWKYLSQRTDHYDCVLISDSRDVLVQGDPFLYLRRSWHKLHVTSEGFVHSESSWNMVEQFEAQKSVGDFNRNYYFWPVVNGGVVLGRSNYVRNLCFLIWNSVLRNHGMCTDQGVINYLFSFLKEDVDYTISDPHHTHLCITGEAIKENLLKFNPVFKDNQILSLDGQPYILFHQWDRTIFKEDILSKYGAKSILSE